MIDALDELKALRQWVAWRIEWDAKNERKTKPPYNIHTDSRADKTNPEHWASYDEVISYAYRKGIIPCNSGGAGFVFTDKDSYCGIDLDHVIKDGKLIPEAQEIVALMDSYTEYSYSGDGLHILVKLSEPLASFCNKHRADLGIASRIEIYDSAWYFTVSGKPYGEPKPITERTQQCKQLCAKFLTPAKKNTIADWKFNPEHYNPNHTSPVDTRTRSEDLPDSELWQRMFNSEHGRDIKALYDGDISAYGHDHSSADLALCSYLNYWTNGDPSRIDSMFRQSGLMRDKWDESHNSKGDTYGQITIARAINGKNADSSAPITSNNARNDSESNHRGEAGSSTFNSHLADYLDSRFALDLADFALYKNRKTGFANFDKDNSLYPGLYAIGGVSGAGKTTFIHQIADNLARAGEFVLYFSLEQTILELASKGLSRLTAQESPAFACTALEIRNGKNTEAVQRAIRIYKSFAEKIRIYQCDFDTDVDYIIQEVRDFISATGKKPVVILDYLQILRPSKQSERRSKSTKEAVDDTVHALKKLQADNGLVMFVISSFNRQNYLTVADFESFKESGLIEYSADFVAALQLTAMNADLLDTQNKLIAKREFVGEEKKRQPRDIELLVLKNRYGRSYVNYFFTYDARHDLFTPNDIDKEQALTLIQARAKAIEEKHAKSKKGSNNEQSGSYQYGEGH